MSSDQLARQAEKHLHYLCEEISTRQIGSPGNQAATRYFAEIMHNDGFVVERQPFDCLDMRLGEIDLSAGNQTFNAFISPYSPGCDVEAELVRATTIKELEQINANGKLLLLTGEITAEQLMPKNFVFYNPEHHQKIYRLLEEKMPAAIIAATKRNPELTGGLYPFPMFEDGDFDIPSAYMTDVEGEKLSEYMNSNIRLKMDAERIPSTAENISARKGDLEGRIVVCAHIDAKAGTPGALDNAGGTIILMLLADLLKTYHGNQSIELLAINGEDNFSAGGEMEYLRRHQGNFNQIRLVINIDGAGYKAEPTGISFYECPQDLQEKTTSLLGSFKGIVEMPQWYQGDHMVFISQGVPAIAITTSGFAEVWSEIAHTEKDTPELIDTSKLADAARFIFKLINEI